MRCLDSVRRLVLCAAIVLAVSCSSRAHAALIFNLTSTGNSNADAGFQAAAAYVSSQFNDNIEVNITAGFADLGAGVLGSASSVQAGYNFSSWKAGMVADATTADDATMVTGLPGGSTFSRWINNTTDNGGAAHLNTGLDTVRLSNANAKALGLIGATNGANDATITFTSNTSVADWDFDRSDGIDGGKLDFVGVAIHEIMHAMGFISGVDILDINGVEQFSDAAFAPFVSGLDFTRQSATAIAGGADMDWTVGTAAKDYSIDGGSTTLITNAWSTGVNFGDGRQASHWKDNAGLGILDPTAVGAGQLNIVTTNDLQALDVIGWDFAAIPEPSSCVLSLIAFAICTCRRRKSRLPV